MTKAPKLLFLGVIGNAIAVYRRWASGEADPTLPIRAYTAQLHDVAHALGLDTVIAHTDTGEGEFEGGRLRFVSTLFGPRQGPLAYPRKQIARARRFARLVREEAPDVVLMSTSAPLVTLRLIDRRRPVVLSMHNTFWPMHQPPPPSLKTRLRRAIWRTTLSRIDAAICTSEECARQLSQFVSEGTPIRVEKPVLAREIAPKPAAARARRLVYVGRVEGYKGVFLLLEAFERVAARVPDLSLVYVGDGGAFAELSRRVAASPVADRIRLTGQLSGDAVHDELHAADLLVCPTLSSFLEGLALVGPEAAAHGVPSLLSSVVPAQDLLGPAARVFAADDVDALETELDRIVTDEAVYRDLVAGAHAVARELQDTSESWGTHLQALLVDLLPGREAAA